MIISKIQRLLGSGAAAYIFRLSRLLSKKRGSEHVIVICFLAHCSVLDRFFGRYSFIPICNIGQMMLCHVIIRVKANLMLLGNVVKGVGVICRWIDTRQSLLSPI